MRRNIPEPPKMILTLVPEVGADGQDGVTESAGPRWVIDVSVSGRQETGARVAGELALSGTHTHPAVHPVRLSKLQGRAGPVFEDVLASVEEVCFALPGWPQKAFPVCFVENGDGSAPALYGPVAGNLVDLQMLDGHGDVVFSLRTFASVPDLAPMRMVAAVLWIHTHPPTALIGSCLSASESAELRRSTQETVRACCSRTSAYARRWQSAARSQYSKWSRARLWWPRA